MPFALILIGIVMIVAGVEDTQDDLYTLLKGDFFGPNNFFFWMMAIGVIVAVGKVPNMEPLSDAFLVLVLIMIVIHNKDFLTQINTALKGGTT